MHGFAIVDFHQSDHCLLKFNILSTNFFSGADFKQWMGGGCFMWHANIVFKSILSIKNPKMFTKKTFREALVMVRMCL